ncbi:hypothetical protein KIW84_031629 [Lathyrus oleraceus]|uniref:Uncharacterized protein n=1 Tax=Pisum sativum TaxID=3888 RepID=A0A9D4XR48_PEA|nr:hypothetical protein KIW84_031629 [Pisum sativum]
MLNANDMPTHMTSSSKLSKVGSIAIADPTQFRSVIGALQYATLIRPEISFSVNKVCQFLSNPLEEHWKAVKRVLRYLSGTIHHGLLIQPTSTKQPLHLLVKSPRCVDEMVKLDGYDDEGVGGFNDSEDQRTSAIADGFDGIDISLPINKGTIVTGLLAGSKKKKREDNEYVTDGLDNSDPDVSDDDNVPMFDKVKKNQLNKNFKFKWECLCSKVDLKHTYAIKTIIDNHTYARVLDNRSANSRVNAGYTMKINVDRPNPSIQLRFESFYFCFGGCKKGFINGCRPFVGVDGCYLKTKYGGQLLIAVDRDPNDQYFPLDFGVVETETKDNWRKRLDNEVAMSGHWMPTWAMDDNFQVTHSYNTHEFIVDIAKREKYALCYAFAVSPINGQEMWHEVQSEELLPPMYKKGPDRPRKLRIRECGEDDSRRGLFGVSYRCTKCDKFGHNVQSCKSKKQDPNALKIKKKIKADAGNVNQSGSKAGTKTETDINTTNPAM